MNESFSLLIQLESEPMGPWSQANLNVLQKLPGLMSPERTAAPLLSPAVKRLNNIVVYSSPNKRQKSSDCPPTDTAKRVNSTAAETLYFIHNYKDRPNEKPTHHKTQMSHQSHHKTQISQQTQTQESQQLITINNHHHHHHLKTQSVSISTRNMLSLSPQNATPHTKKIHSIDFPPPNDDLTKLIKQSREVAQQQTKQNKFLIMFKNIQRKRQTQAGWEMEAIKHTHFLQEILCIRELSKSL